MMTLYPTKVGLFPIQIFAILSLNIVVNYDQTIISHYQANAAVIALKEHDDVNTSSGNPTCVKGQEYFTGHFKGWKYFSGKEGGANVTPYPGGIYTKIDFSGDELSLEEKDEIQRKIEKEIEKSKKVGELLKWKGNNLKVQENGNDSYGKYLKVALIKSGDESEVIAEYLAGKIMKELGEIARTALNKDQAENGNDPTKQIPTEPLLVPEINFAERLYNVEQQSGSTDDTDSTSTTCSSDKEVKAKRGLKTTTCSCFTGALSQGKKSQTAKTADIIVDKRLWIGSEYLEGFRTYDDLVKDEFGHKYDSTIIPRRCFGTAHEAQWALRQILEKQSSEHIETLQIALASSLAVGDFDVHIQNLGVTQGLVGRIDLGWAFHKMLEPKVVENVSLLKRMSLACWKLCSNDSSGVGVNDGAEANQKDQKKEYIDYNMLVGELANYQHTTPGFQRGPRNHFRDWPAEIVYEDSFGKFAVIAEAFKNSAEKIEEVIQIEMTNVIENLDKIHMVGKSAKSAKCSCSKSRKVGEDHVELSPGKETRSSDATYKILKDFFRNYCGLSNREVETAADETADEQCKKDIERFKKAMAMRLRSFKKMTAVNTAKKNYRMIQKVKSQMGGFGAAAHEVANQNRKKLSRKFSRRSW